MATSWQERSISHGNLQLAVRVHGPDSAEPVLALHGWRDNAATFELLAPLMPELRLIAPDMPGHGRSSWRNREAGYYIWSYLEDVLAVADALRLRRFSLLGHSMGGAIACLLAALLPERINKLILLDSLGPLATAPVEAPGQMLRAMQQQQTLKAAYRHHYRSFETAVLARAAKGLSLAAATVLGQRGIAEDDSGFYWTLDPRLSKTNLLSLSEEQAAAFLRQIACPTLLIAAPGYWQQRKDWFELRRGYFQQLVVEELPGSHHQHLEGQVAEVAALAGNFLQAR